MNKTEALAIVDRSLESNNNIIEDLRTEVINFIESNPQPAYMFDKLEKYLNEYHAIMNSISEAKAQRMVLNSLD